MIRLECDYTRIIYPLLIPFFSTQPNNTFIAMNFGTVARRAYSTRAAIPPTIGSTKAIGSPKDAARMAKVVNFYKGLPNGPAPAARSSGYQGRHFDGKNSDMTPVFQTIAAVFALSYTIDYHFHLKHHKNVAHH